MTAAPYLGYWLAASPRLGRGWSADVAALSAHLADGEDVVASLPDPDTHGPDDRHQVDLVRQECRAVRSSFMERHAERLYAEARDGDTPRVEVLAARIAHLVPGLLPTDPAADDLAVGTVFAGLLRVPAVGCRLVEDMLRPTSRAVRLAAEPIPAWAPSGSSCATASRT